MEKRIVQVSLFLGVISLFPAQPVSSIEGRMLHLESFISSIISYQSSALTLASLGVMRQQLQQASLDSVKKKYKNVREKQKKQNLLCALLQQENQELREQLQALNQELTQFYREYKNDQFERELLLQQQKPAEENEDATSDSLAFSPLTPPSGQSSYELLTPFSSPQSRAVEVVSKFIPESTDDEESE